MIFCLAVLAVYFVCIVFLFYLSSVLNKSNDLKGALQKARPEITIPALINVILYKLFDRYIYENIVG
jgi:hypothetical protein